MCNEYYWQRSLCEMSIIGRGICVKLVLLAEVFVKNEYYWQRSLCKIVLYWHTFYNVFRLRLSINFKI